MPEPFDDVFPDRRDERVSRMLTKLSLRVRRSERACIVSETFGGLRPTTVKNEIEIGARFATPSVDRVLTQAIGRGITER